MKSKLLKLINKKNNNTDNKVNNIDVKVNIVHIGKVLTEADIISNRSSKYTFLNFS